MINRRTFLCGLTLGWLSASLNAEGQQPQEGKVYRIGWLRAGQPTQAWVDALEQGLRDRGYVDGQNVLMEFRFTDGSIDQLPQFAAELLRSKVDIILASGAPAALAAKKTTTSVPILMTSVFDPVELGLVSSLARPGGNITGLAISSADLATKRLELLKELVPKLTRVAVPWDPSNPTNPLQLKVAAGAAHSLALQLEPVPVRGPADFDSAFKAMRGADGLVQIVSTFITTICAR